MNELEIFLKDGTSIIAGYEKSEASTKRAADALVALCEGKHVFLYTDTHVVAADNIKYFTLLEKDDD